MVFDIQRTYGTIGSLREKVREIEIEEVLNAMRACNWIMAGAAKKLTITERMIGYKIRKYKIRKEEDGEHYTLYSTQQKYK